MLMCEIKGGHVWPPEAVSMLRLMWERGDSTDSIAKALRIYTPKAVRTKAKRMGFERRSVQRDIVGRFQPRRQRPNYAIFKLAPKPGELEPLLRDGAPVTLEIATHGDCRWIVAEGNDTQLCGHATYRGTSWCHAHYRRVFSVPPA